jgi:hypothetical protein
MRSLVLVSYEFWVLISSPAVSVEVVIDGAS